MKLFVFACFSLVIMSAKAQLSTPVYFVGEQKITATENKECFLELEYSADLKMVSLRSILTNTHDNILVPVGKLEATYMFIGGSIQKNGYYFQDKAPKAPVKQLVLIAEDPKNPMTLTAAVFHEGHHDPSTCDGLVLAEGAELDEAVELFANFENLNENNHAH